MNIFYLDNDPTIAAQMHCDKHVVKMILETAQLLSTAHRLLDGTQYIDSSSGRKIKRWKLNGINDSLLYKATHINHPSNVWVRETSGNYEWTYNLFVALCDEYTFRYGKTHLTDTKLRAALKNIPKNILNKQKTIIPQCMPNHCARLNPVSGYRNYYITEKKSMLKYTKRNVPSWV